MGLHGVLRETGRALPRLRRDCRRTAMSLSPEGAPSKIKAGDTRKKYRQRKNKQDPADRLVLATTHSGIVAQLDSVGQATEPTVCIKRKHSLPLPDSQNNDDSRDH